MINFFKRLYIRFRPLTKSMILEKAKCYKTTGLCHAIKRVLRDYGYDIYCTDASDIRNILQMPMYDIKEAVSYAINYISILIKANIYENTYDNSYGLTLKKVKCY